MSSALALVDGYPFNSDGGKAPEFFQQIECLFPAQDPFPSPGMEIIGENFLGLCSWMIHILLIMLG
jgi:hypothetical protein